MIWLIIFLGLILRLISLNQSLWLDEVINVLATRNYSFVSMITEYAKADFHPPGFFMILWVWAKIFGTSEIAVRIPSVIFGVLAIYIVFLVGQKVYSKKLGLISAFLLAINPLHIYYSQEARMYSLATISVLVNIYLFIKLIKQEKVSYFFLILSNYLILMSDYVAYLIFPVQLVFLLTNINRSKIKRWITAFVAAFVLEIWWIPTFLNQLKVGSVTADKLPAWKFIVGGFDVKAVPLTYIKFIIGRISYPDKFIYALILLPVCLLFMLLIIRGIKITTPIFRKLLILWIVIPVIAATLISLAVPIYSYFRMIFILPAFLILTSLGIVSFKKEASYIFLSLVIFIEIVSSSIYLLNPVYQREDWRGLVNFLQSQASSSLTLFESPGTLPPFDYYAGNSINSKGALKDFPIKDNSGLIVLNGISRDVYLVDYLVEISDPNRLVKKKLNELGYREIGTNNFYGVGFVYHYVK